MPGWLGIIASALSVAVVSIGTTEADAQTRPKFVVMGADAAPASIPRSSPIFESVLAALNDSFNSAGFDMYDEVGLSLDKFRQGQERRSYDTLIDIARSVTRPPINKMVGFTVYVNIERQSFSKLVVVRLDGRILDVKTNRVDGTSSGKSGLKDRIRLDCRRDCLVGAVAEIARRVAADVGDNLVAKARANQDKERFGVRAVTAYNVKFSGFSDDDLGKIDESVKLFKKIKDLLLVEASFTGREFRFESNADALVLNRQISAMFENMDIKARVQYSAKSHEFVIKKILSRERDAVRQEPRKPSPPAKAGQK